MTVYQDEVFGPLLGVVRVPTFDDAIKLLEDNPYGNGTAIFTRDGGAARQFTEEAPVGMVGVNVPIPVPVAYHSFGGWKDSIFSDTAMYGPEGVRFYTKPQALTTRWPGRPVRRSISAFRPTDPGAARRSRVAGAALRAGDLEERGRRFLCFDDHEGTIA